LATFLAILTAIPGVATIMSVAKDGVVAISKGFKLIAWQYTISKLVKRKKEIQNADTPGQFMDLNKR
jgi:hypothetical protein